MTSGSASLDIFELFGETIEGFRTRQDSVIELIWESQIENEDFEDGEALDVKVLSRWLSPQDRVLATTLSLWTNRSRLLVSGSKST